MPRTRKLIERNDRGQFCAPVGDIKRAVECSVQEILDKFPEVDSNDIFLIIVRSASHICAMEQLRDFCADPIPQNSEETD